MREVRGRQLQRDAHVFERAREILARQRVHQVQVEIAESRGVQFRHCNARVVAAVDAAEARKLCGREALRAERDAIDAGGAVFGKAPALDGAGVGLERDLGAGLERQEPSQ